MNSRNRRILESIFAEPPPADVAWRDIEAVFRALGAEISEGRGSRARVFLNGTRAVFHRPHPGPETKRSAVRSVRDFLTMAGVMPDEE